MSAARPPRLGVVADDITGAGDIGSMLAAHGWVRRAGEILLGWGAERLDESGSFGGPGFVLKALRRLG